MLSDYVREQELDVVMESNTNIVLLSLTFEVEQDLKVHNV